MGSAFGLAAWTNGPEAGTGYTVVTAVTGAGCAFLPAISVKAALRWADRKIGPDERDQ